MKPPTPLFSRCLPPPVYALPLLLAAVLLAGCSLLGGPSPVLPLPTPVAPTHAPTHAPTTAPTVPGNEAATPTGIAPTPDPSLPPTPTLVPLSAQERLDLFDQVWGLVNTRWVYTDFRGLNWPAIHDEYKPKIAAAADEHAVYRVLSDMIQLLGDRHSGFSDPQQAAEDDAMQQGTLRLSGIGVISQDLDKAVRVVYVIPGGPAAHAGLRPFDIIRAVNGVQLTNNNDAPYLIRGPAGTAVTLTIETPTQAPRDVTIVRAAVTFAFHASAQRLPGTNIAYLDLPTFDADGISDEVASTLTTLTDSGPLDGLIIDERQNGGGLLSELDNTLKLFIDGGNIGYVVTRHGRSAETIPAGSTLPALRGKPIVVLVSNLSESAAERFAAAMQSRHRATILGTLTAGNTETVYYHDLPYGARLALAEERYLLPDGTSIEDKGLTPDITLDVPWYNYPYTQDPQVQAAVAHIQGK